MPAIVRSHGAGTQSAQIFTTSGPTGTGFSGSGIGSYRCNQCWKYATTLHESEECHRCRDLGSCGGDADAFWPAATLVVAIAATITVVVFVVVFVVKTVKTVAWAETTRVEVHPHEIVTEAVSWWRRSPTRLAIGFDEITSVALDDEDGPKLLKVQTTLGRTLSGIPDGPGRAAALAIGQRLVAHGRAHTIKNDATRIHLGLDGSSSPTY